LFYAPLPLQADSYLQPPRRSWLTRAGGKNLFREKRCARDQRTRAL
jgi:hypothetical protein